MTKSKTGTTYTSNVHVLRATKRMSQAELAKLVGCSRQTIIQIERNRYNPSLLLAKDIAHVFGVPMEQAFEFTHEESD
jgi:putative transcriptional regulator